MISGLTLWKVIAGPSFNFIALLELELSGRSTCILSFFMNHVCKKLYLRGVKRWGVSASTSFSLLNMKSLRVSVADGWLYIVGNTVISANMGIIFFIIFIRYMYICSICILPCVLFVYPYLDLMWTLFGLVSACCTYLKFLFSACILCLWFLLVKRLVDLHVLH